MEEATVGRAGFGLITEVGVTSVTGVTGVTGALGVAGRLGAAGVLGVAGLMIWTVTVVMMATLAEKRVGRWKLCHFYMFSFM